MIGFCITNVALNHEIIPDIIYAGTNDNTVYVP